MLCSFSAWTLKSKRCSLFNTSVCVQATVGFFDTTPLGRIDPEPFLLRPVQCRRQPALHLKHLFGKCVRPGGDSGRDELRSALGPAAAGSSGSALPPHPALLPTHVPRAQTPLQPHPVPGLFTFL